jgi:phosphoenolpyruvate-protein kinase (PTS system EI component)
MKKVAEGISCSSKVEIEGEIAYIKIIEDVIELFDKAEGKICIVADAGITTLGPILSELCATICTTGGAGSHLAIISREFGLPCIMSAKFSIPDLSVLQGKKAKIAHNGQDKGFLYLID